MKKKESLEATFARLKATLDRIKKADEARLTEAKKGGLTIDQIMSAFLSLSYGKTRIVRAMAKKRGISVEAMLIDVILPAGLMAQKEQLRKWRDGKLVIR